MYRKARAAVLMGSLIIALMAMGFAHRLMPAPSAELAAFLQIGGSLADICHGMPQSQAGLEGCPFCHLGAGGSVGGQNQDWRAANLYPAGTRPAPCESLHTARLFDPAAPLRGPPPAVTFL